MTTPAGMSTTTNRMPEHVDHNGHNGNGHFGGHVGHTDPRTVGHMDPRTAAPLDRHVRHAHRGDETKPSWKTTELGVYLLAVIGVLIASAAVGDSGGAAGDIFAADKAWWYITLLTIGYMVSRGLAKAGSRTRDNDPRTSR